MKPVIDVHAHIFNARDIPLKGYLSSRDPITPMEVILSKLRLRRIMIILIARCIRSSLSPKKKKKQASKTLCKLILKIVYMAMGKQYRKWADTLSKEVKSITSEMVETFQKDEIGLYVPLMIDFEYWFRNSPDNPIIDQIEFVHKNIIIPSKGRIHPFVPFCPARELAFRKNMLNPDRRPELSGSLQLVKDAIENKGFIGVKLYNSMGYKPFNNATVEDKRKERIGLHRKRGYHIFKGEEYDEVLSELYEYCIENDVPITTHCGMYGIESYNNASFDFGQAVFWHEVLSQKRFEDLHLNLAHFGWCQEHRYHGRKGWVKDICEMLIEYKYLFTDVSHHRVLSGRDRKKFKDDYRDMRSDFEDHWPDIKKKILFGIDWHVIKRVKNFENFKDKYVEVLKHDGLFNDAEIKDFLGGNALGFLGLKPGGKNRARLEKFYQKENIEPPKWFKDTELPQANLIA